ncbi:hypothetical protein NIES4071_63150 [Calothrix sp. NIES-4071]|nr:hypothetical protein NIES4071_63150 [Calothrix sp. NIES-4071]BAZ60618.1 hypothetical protein NIES4105_63100 [Calothrix sp. NIES-4105]
MSASDWERFLAEGRQVVEIVRKGLKNRGINAGESIMTDFGTDEDIPVYSSDGERKLFWISVKTVTVSVYNFSVLPNGYRGWMCGEVESKQWVNPPSAIIWYCPTTRLAWGTIPPRRLSQRWFIFPDRWGTVEDKRKTKILRQATYVYPSWLVLPEHVISKQEIIGHIQRFMR